MARSLLPAARIRWGAAAWLLGVLQYFVCQVVVAAQWNTPYSWTRNFISDLGNTACGPFSTPHGQAAYVCSPAHTTMNVSFVVSGVLAAAGIVLLRPLWAKRRTVTVATWLWIASAAGKVLVGLAPENTNIALHSLGALNIPCGGLAVLLLSRRGGGLGRPWERAGLALGRLGLIGATLSITGQFTTHLPLGAGLAERLASYPANGWMVLIGALAMVRARAQAPTTAGPVTAARTPRVEPAR
ncbi:DUF998 domain-containing protein (plasmid) [Streptomyces sp. NBC_01136]|uniref:DUF998 domain-containing protein n=1 Tax=unclassified Streptomyces TaxID=2593676 RepID=UPI002F90A52F|nr:DUF998 domain-containing protein [Streptomyces sp. NBC_01136]